MSDKPEKKEGKEEKKTEVKEEIKKEDITVKVDRSKVEKEQQNQITGLEVEKSELAKQLTTAQEELQRLQDEQKTKGTEYTDILKERDELKDRIADIAITEFNKTKGERLQQLKDAGLDEEKVTEFDEKIQTPEDLKMVEITLEYLSEQLKAAQPDPEGGPTDPPEVPATPSTPDNPPEGSVVSIPQTGDKKYVYQTAKDAVDDLYEKVRKGGPEGEEANKILNQMWRQAIPTMLRTRVHMAISKCLQCGTGMERGQPCPDCGFDPAMFAASGGEIF